MRQLFAAIALLLCAVSAIAGDGFDVLKKHEGIYGYDLKERRADYLKRFGKHNPTEKDIQEALGYFDYDTFVIKGKAIHLFRLAYCEDSVWKLAPGKQVDGEWQFEQLQEGRKARDKRYVAITDGKVRVPYGKNHCSLVRLEGERLAKHQKQMDIIVNGYPKTAPNSKRIRWARQTTLARLKQKLDAEPELLTIAGEGFGGTLLHGTVQTLDVERLRVLVAHKAFDPKLVRDRRKENALHQVVNDMMTQVTHADRVPEVITILVKAGVDPHAKNKRGKTPLTLAREAKSKVFLETFAKLGIKHDPLRGLRKLDELGQNRALCKLAADGRLDDLKVVLKAGIRYTPNRKNQDSPILAALKYRARIDVAEKIVTLLLNAGVPAYAESVIDTPLMKAISLNAPSIVELLLQHHASTRKSFVWRMLKKYTDPKIRPLLEKYNARQKKKPVITLLAARRVGDHVQILCSNRWPKGFGGFTIKRRVVGTDKWTTVNPRPILMRLVRDIDWPALDPKPEEQERLKTLAQDLVAKKKLWGTIIKEEYYEAPGKQRFLPPPNNVIREYAKDPNFDKAMIYGVGCIDRGADPKQEIEYGAFPVMNGKTAEKPEQICLLPRDLKKIKLLSTLASTEGFKVRLDWSINGAACERFGIRDFFVYREQANGKKEKLTHAYLRDHAENGYIYYGEALFELPQNKPYTFLLVPRSYFMQEMDVAFRVKYVPGRNHTGTPAPKGPERVSTRVVNRTTHKISWKMPYNGPHRVKCFRVYRCESTDDETGREITTKPLPPGTTEYIVTGKFKLKTFYNYRLRTEFESGDVHDSKVSQLNHAYAPIVTGLKAKYIVKDGRRYIHMTWNPLPEDEQEIFAEFVIGDGHDNFGFAHDVSLGRKKLKKCEYFLRTTNRQPTTYTVGVAVRTTWHKLGDFVKVKVKVPGVK